MECTEDLGVWKEAKAIFDREQETFRKDRRDPEKDLYAATTALKAAVHKLMEGDSALKERRRRILLVDINEFWNAC
jgi:hypothetical protein